MALEQYANVITRVIAENQDKDPAEVTLLILDRVKLAMTLMADLELPAAATVAKSTTSPVRMRTSQPPKPLIQTAATEFGASAIIIGEEPPNASGYATQRKAQAIDYHTQEELAGLVAANMPMAFTLELPSMKGTPIKIMRRIQQPPLQLQGEAGKDTVTSFVRVQYVQKDQEDGPTIQIFTTEESPNWDVLKADIIAQAQAMYRKERVKIIAKAPPPEAAPTDAELAAASERDRRTQAAEGERFTAEDQKDAALIRSGIETSARSRGITNLEQWKPQ